MEVISTEEVKDKTRIQRFSSGLDVHLSHTQFNIKPVDSTGVFFTDHSLDPQQSLSSSVKDRFPSFNYSLKSSDFFTVCCSYTALSDNVGNMKK